MQAVRSDWTPKNKITTPLTGTPYYVNSGIIKAVMKSGEKISVAQIDYQEFDEENFQYVIIPYWDIIDGLPASVFQGLPGIDMELRLDHYYRVNYIPVFITERTPSENREDLWEILETVGLDYLSRDLQNMAEVRLENPEVSLKDLGELLDKPLGRSGANHRLKKISEIADALREERGDI